MGSVIYGDAGGLREKESPASVSGMGKKVFGCLGILLVAALMVSVVVNVVLLAGAGGKGWSKAGGRGEFQEVVLEGPTFRPSGRIAVVDLFGVISYGVYGQVHDTMVDDIVAKLKQAREDDSIKAVLLHIDSPGGEVTASDVLYHEVSKTAEKKPVVAYFDSVAASGAYYAAMGADKIVANELCITASIGVIMQTLNVEQLAEKVGVSALTFKSGKMKDLLNPTRQPTQEEMAYVQSLIDETYAKFLGIVARERGLDERELREGLADGRIVSGKTAAAARLVDQTGYFEDAVRVAREAAGLDENAQVVRFVAPFTFSAFLRTLGHAPKVPTLRIQVGPELPQLEAGKLYFLSPHLYGR
jgi:protease-4